MSDVDDLRERMEAQGWVVEQKGEHLHAFLPEAREGEPKHLLIKPHVSKTERFNYPDGVDHGMIAAEQYHAVNQELRAAIEGLQRAAESDRLRIEQLRAAADGLDLDNARFEQVVEQLGVELATYKRAVGNASYCLDPNQGEQPDRVAAYQWLRTTFPKDHPNYVDPASLPKGYHDE